MRRRDFLLASAATCLAAPAAAQMKMDHGAHGMTGMPGMSGAPMAPMAPMASGPVPPEGAKLRELPRLANRATAPGSFEAALRAGPATARFAPSAATPILGYNGESPGPLIEVTEGDRVRIDFRNEIPGQPTTVHWHGMPVPADQDGNPMDPVASGAGRVYEFTLPEGSAASYWYHPHPHGRTAEQVYMGLAGVFLVRPKVDPVPAEYGDTVLFLTDLRLAADGTIPASNAVDQMNGRVGDHVLVNGQRNPVLSVPAGTRRRFRLFNATNARYLRLRFGDAPMTIIGSDGGLLEAPVAAAEILLAPAERVELVVAFDRPGTAALKTLPYDRGWMGSSPRPDDGDLTLLTVEVTAPARAAAPPPLPAVLRAVPALGAPVERRRFTFSESMRMDGSSMTMSFMINGRTFDMNRIDVAPRVGAVELWEIENPTDMDHPFHIHGTMFQVVEIQGAGGVRKPGYRAWKDTVNVARGETVRFLIRQDMPGQRMFHCHILEHEDLGMMGIAGVVAVT